jgi:xanthine/CO dehydrogenase XdhC/CoxF family maturation factor/CTP:molybdopterin cytidylyltransferase MocA
MELRRLLDQCLAAGGGDCALATVVETIGPAYRRAGARQIIRNDRKTWGAITGGCVESDLILHALAAIERGEPAVVRYSPSDDDPILGLGSGCGGEIVVLLEPLTEQKMKQLQARLSSPASSQDAVCTVYRASEARLLGTHIASGAHAATGVLIQPITQSLSLILFGAASCAQPLVRFARELGWKVTIADHRSAVREDERFSLADELVIAPVDELPARFQYSPPSAAVVMTHHYLHDFEILKQLLPRPLSYIGVVGSRRRAERLISDLQAVGVTPETLSRLHAPAGLDLGADTPSEIALSIIAEIQAAQHGTTATSLRDRRGSIHDDARRTAIAILAAGGSRRMGSPKALLTLEGQSLVRRAAQSALAADGGPVYVIAGAESDAIRAQIAGLPVQVVLNSRWEEGIASSIRTAVEALEAQDRPLEALILTLCDQPRVSAHVLRRLLGAHRTTRASVVASRYPDGPGVPALFCAEMFDALKSLRGDIGARQLIRHLNREVVTIPFDTPADIDTSADLDLFASSGGPTEGG